MTARLLFRLIRSLLALGWVIVALPPTTLPPDGRVLGDTDCASDSAETISAPAAIMGTSALKILARLPLSAVDPERESRLPSSEAARSTGTGVPCGECTI